MEHTGKFMIFHTFHNVEHSNHGIWHEAPKKIINGLYCYIWCRKKDESEWVCLLFTYYDKTPPSLGRKVEFKIRTKNGVETVGTTDGTIGNRCITFRNDPKCFVNGNMTIECHVEIECHEQQKSKEEHKKKETLSCNICLLEYGEEGDRTPRVLDCGHTLCLGCCKQIVQSIQIQCPFCRVVTHLTGRTIFNLPKNYLALSM